MRDSEIAARSVGLNPVIVKTAAFALSAVFTGLAGGMFAPLIMFVAPDSFPFSQSILFLLAVIVGGAGFVFGPAIGAAIAVLSPELLSGLAEYRLLFFGALLLVVLWLAPEGVLGTLSRYLPSFGGRRALNASADVAAFLKSSDVSPALEVSNIAIAFGGVKAAQDVSFTAPPGKVTSVIGPNGAGKTTVLNMIGGFYAPDSGSVRLGAQELAGAAAWKIARAGIARTYQTTKLFETLSVLDNVLIAMRRGKLGGLLSSAASGSEEAMAVSLLHFVGYRGDPDAIAGSLPHIDRRLVEIARALATRPKILMLDEPGAGLMRSDKEALAALIRAIADLGIAVILVEHDMLLVMGISDQIVVLDAGRPLAEGKPAEIRQNPKVLKAYLGGGELRARPRSKALPAGRDMVLTVVKLTAGYGAAPVLDGLSFDVSRGETVAILGSNGAGKSTTMRVISGLHRGESGEIVFDNVPIANLEAHRIAALGLALVPEGRQVFPELTVYDNIALGAYTRENADIDGDIRRLLERFPRLKDRIDSRAGLSVGRRAADARHCPGSYGQSSHSDARRALARPRARDDQRVVRYPGRAARRRRHDPAGRPDGRARTHRRRPRLCARTGPLHQGRLCRRTGRRSGAGSRLSRRQGKICRLKNGVHRGFRSDPARSAHCRQGRARGRYRYS